MARKVCDLLCSNIFFVQAKKLVEDATREKDNMVMKYAVAEQKNIELAEKMETVEERMREMTKERENVISKFKVLKTDRDKAALAFESRVRTCAIFSSPVGSLCHTRGVVWRPSYVVCRLCPP